MVRSRALLVLLMAVTALIGTTTGATAKQEPPPSCTPRMLVFGAFPAELDLLLAQAQLERDKTVVIDGRRFYVGTLAGNDVVLAMTGIGLVNAEKAARDAYAHFGCGDGSGIAGVVFSGVAGGHYIGDVAVPSRWTLDEKTWFRADARMLRTAKLVARSGNVQLGRDVPVGDPACLCTDPHMLEPVELPRQPEVVVGGEGISADSFGGRRLPCFPNGGDVFGCEPCREQSGDPPDVERFATGIAPFLDPAFFAGFFENPPVADPRWESQDMETAAVFKVAAEHDTPFIAFRAVSDGEGDPLMLPGFPFQFFAYRHVAADNAALMTIAFLAEWAG